VFIGFERTFIVYSETSLTWIVLKCFLTWYGWLHLSRKAYCGFLADLVREKNCYRYGQVSLHHVCSFNL